MKNQFFFKILYSILVAIMVVFCGFAHADFPVPAGAKIRPISDFLKTQGTALSVDLGPVKRGNLIVGAQYIWGTNTINNALGQSITPVYLVDSSGIDNKGEMNEGVRSASTFYPGSFIVEQPIAGGHAEDTVYLNTVNAISYITETSNYASCSVNGGHATAAVCPAIFGYNLLEIANGAKPVLGIQSTVIKFINSAPGAPIPDMVSLSFTPGQIPYLETWTIQAFAFGPLRATYGVPDGTPGLATLNVTINTSQNIDNEIINLIDLNK